MSGTVGASRSELASSRTTGRSFPPSIKRSCRELQARGSLAYEKRWKTIWEAERSAVKMLQMAVLLPKGKWLPEDAEARILISTRRGQCPEESDLRDPSFHERLVAVLTSHHVVPGSGLSVEWDPELSFQHWGKVPIASLEGTVTRKDGTRVGIRYVFIPGGDRFFRVKAVAREPWRKEVFDTLDRMLEGFQGAKEHDGSSLRSGLLRGGLIGALLLLGVFLWQQRSGRSAGRTSLKSPEASVR